MFSEHKRINREISNRKMFEKKSPNNWKLNNNTGVPMGQRKNQKGSRKYFEMNEIKNKGQKKKKKRRKASDFSGGPGDKKLPANAGNTGSISGLGRFYMLWRN